MKTTNRITAVAAALAIAGGLAACSQPVSEPTVQPVPSVTAEPTSEPIVEPTVVPVPEPVPSVEVTPEPVVLGPGDKLTDEQKAGFAGDLERIKILTDGGTGNSAPLGALRVDLDALYDETGQQVLVVVPGTTPTGPSGEWLAVTRASSERWLEIGKATVSMTRKETLKKAKAWAKAQPDTWTVIAVAAN